MKPFPAFCCSALINPYYPMVETFSTQHPLSLRLLRLLAGVMAGGTVAQALSWVTVYFSIEDSQAAGMLAHLIIEHLSYYFLGYAFVILSLSNLLIKRGMSTLKVIRLPSLIFITSIAVASFLIIPRMDYLRETALQDGMPVMLSPFANYFAVLNGLTLLLVCTQIFSSTLVAWRLSEMHST